MNPVTGDITPSASAAGTYTVTYSIPAAGGCNLFTTTTNVTITDLPTATVSYIGAPFCLSIPGVQSVTLSGTGAYIGGTYGSTAGLTINPATGAITPGTSTAGTYIVTYLIPASGGCAAVPVTTSVTITAVPTASINYAGSPFCRSLVAAQSVTLTGTGAYTGGTYSSTAGLTINPATGDITPATSTAGTYTVTYTIPASGGCASVLVTASVTVTDLPTASISYAGTPFCTSIATAQSVTLTGTGAYTGGTYSSSAGLTINPATGAITPGTSTAGTYIVTYLIPASGGCAAVPVTTSVTITAVPTASISYAGSPFCRSLATAQSVTLTGTGAYTGGTYSSTAGLTINPATGDITPATSTAGTYIVTYLIPASGGCAAATVTASVTITAVPTASISYAGNPYCSSLAGSQPVTITGTGAYTGGTYSSTAGLTINPVTGDITPGTSSSGTYTVTYAIPATGGCASIPVTTTITITTLPVATFSYTGTPYCSSSPNPLPTFSGGGVAGAFSSTAGLSFVSTATGQVNLGSSTPGVYTVINTIAAAGGCSVVTSSSPITITAVPTANISYAGTPFCNSIVTAQPVTLTGTAAYTGGAYSSTPGLTIDAVTGGITPGTSTAGTYTVTYTIPASSGCASVLVTTSITITALPTASINYAGTPYCSTIGAGQAVTLTGTSGGTYTSLPAGLTLNPVTGAINPSLSAAGTYTVTYTIAAAGGCGVVTATAPVTITALSAATFSYAGTPYCSSGVDPLPTYSGGGVAGLFTSTAGLVFVSPATGQVDLSASVAGTYTVTNTIAAAGGCGIVTATNTITITTLPTATISYSGSPWCSSAPVQNVTFIGTPGGTFSALPAGLSINAATGAITPGTSTSGTYAITYTIAASGGCGVVTATTNITVNATPTVVVTNPAAVCAPSTVDLTAAAVTAGSTAGLTYTYWTDALATTAYATPATAVAGTYYIKGTDAVTGCFDIKPVTATVNAAPTVVVTNPAAVCAPSTVDLTAAAVTAGSTAGLTYTYWTDALATTAYATPATAVAGTYYIKGTDAVTGCYDIKPVTATVNAAPTVVVTNPAAVCAPSTVDLTAAAVTAGSTAGLTYTYWTDALATTAYATPATAVAGTYYIKGTDAVTGCFDIKPVTATVNAAPTVVVTNPAAVCAPSTVDLTAAAVTAGSTAGLTYTYWTDALATTAYATPATAVAGTYYIKGTDAVTGCYDIKPVTATVNAAPTVVVTNPAAVCAPSTVDLTAAAVTAGSTAGLTYTYWTDALATTAYATPATAVAGTYYIKGTDAVTGCFDIKPVTATVNAAPTVVVTNPAAVCTPSTVDLTAAAVTAGSTAGLTYTYWTDALATTAYATPATAVAGTYYIKGTDAVTGCYDIKPVTATVNTAPTVVVTNPAAVCAPSTVDLTAAAVTAGSTAGLTYTYWTDALATTAYATPATAVAGTYYIKGTDAVTGCFDIKPVTATVNAAPTVVVTNPAAVCAPSTVDLTAAAVTAGSTAGLTYTYWTDALATTAYATPATAVAGTYYIKGTDAVTGCYDIKPVTAIINTSFTVSTTSVNVACFGGTTGTATAIPAGGSGVYTYSWNTIPVQTTATATGLAAGTYTVTVSDGTSCTAISNATLTEPATALSGNIILQTNVTVPGGNDGSVTVAGSGGTSPYLYKIGLGVYQASGNFGSLTAGSYTVTVQDINLCTFDVAVIITQPLPTLSGSISSQTNACFGTSTGSVTIAGSGGLTPYEYSLNAGTYQSSGTFGALAAGTYTVTVRDALLSTFDVIVTITQPASSVGGSITSQTDVLCFGSSTGSLTVTGSGGTSPYLYKLGAGSYQASGIFGTLAAGSYTVTVQDANLCTFDVAVIITQPPVTLTGSIVSKTDISCNGSANGSVTIAGSGGTSPYTYSLNGGTFQISGAFNGLTSATYTITVRDANLCTTNVSVTIIEPAVLSILSDVVDASCPGVSDGSITLTITGGTQPYSVIWSDGITLQDRVDFSNGPYSVVVTDKNGCNARLDIVVGVTGSEKCIEIPTIITPNNDGVNDTWKIKNIDLFPNAEVFVFTRWGKLVFHSKNLAANPWDGTFSGKLLPTDSYHYVLHLNDGSKPRSGVISIIR